MITEIKYDTTGRIRWVGFSYFFSLYNVTAANHVSDYIRQGLNSTCFMKTFSFKSKEEMMKFLHTIVK